MKENSKVSRFVDQGIMEQDERDYTVVIILKMCTQSGIAIPPGDTVTQWVQERCSGS